MELSWQPSAEAPGGVFSAKPSPMHQYLLSPYRRLSEGTGLGQERGHVLRDLPAPRSPVEERTRA